MTLPVASSLLPFGDVAALRVAEQAHGREWHGGHGLACLERVEDVLCVEAGALRDVQPHVLSPRIVVKHRHAITV